MLFPMGAIEVAGISLMELSKSESSLKIFNID